MNTLRLLRPTERIKENSVIIDDKVKTSYVTQQVKDRDGAIIVFLNHSDDIVGIVLSSIDSADSGYVFFKSELLLDPVNNKMVPHHRLATEQEVQELQSRHVSMHRLPILRMTDPIRRWHNFERGTIVAIDRPSSTYFRQVT